MFENFVQGKIENESEIINKLIDTLGADPEVSRINILNSELSDFTKNYLLYDFNEKNNSGEIVTKISKANKLFFNYVLRPKWTLQTFLFNNFESRPPTEIIKKLNLFTFYSFYNDEIKNFITDNFQIFITKAEVTSIIDHTNTAIFDKLTVDINNAKIKNFFLQIFLLKYNLETNYNLDSVISYSFLKIFLEDKSFHGLIKKFYVINGLNDESEISLINIIKVLTDKYNIPEKIEIAAKPNEPGKIEIAVKPNEPKKIDKIVELKEPGKIIPEIPFVKDNLVNSVEIKPDIKKDTEIKKPEREKIYSEQLVNAVEEESKAASETVTKNNNRGYDLKGLFNEKQLAKISARIYNSDLIYREKSFNKLSDFKTWFEASNHLKEIFENNNIDIYNKDVISFVNILNDYFHNNKE